MQGFKLQDLFYGNEDMIRVTDNPDMDWCIRMIKFWIRTADADRKPVLVKFLRRLEAGEARSREEIERLRAELNGSNYNRMGLPPDEMEDAS